MQWTANTIAIALGINAFVWAVLGAYVSTEKGRPAGEGFALGLLFWPVGVLIAALLPTNRDELARQREAMRRHRRGGR